MNEKNIFIPLFKHEFSIWRRRRSGGTISGIWWLVYGLVFLILLIGFTTWAALNDAFQLQGTWYITFALPFFLLFFGFRAVMRELRNHTFGWWLTLPYARKQLIWAKFVSAWVKILLLLAASYLVIVLFSAYITLIQSQYSLSDLTDFMITGLSWYLILFAFSPFAASFGVFIATLSYTPLRPLMAVGFIVYYLMGDLIFLGLGFQGAEMYEQFSGSQTVEWFPYPITFFFPFIAGWVVSYFLIRGSAYLLHKKLTM